MPEFTLAREMPLNHELSQPFKTETEIRVWLNAWNYGDLGTRYKIGKQGCVRGDEKFDSNCAHMAGLPTTPDSYESTT